MPRFFGAGDDIPVLSELSKKKYGTMRPSNNLSKKIPGIHWQWFPDVSVFKFSGN